MKRSLVTTLMLVLILYCLLPASAGTKNMEFRILTWNIQVGADTGLLSNNWPTRKSLIKDSIAKQSADVFCIQEGTSDQIDYLKAMFPKYSLSGVGRDDGKTAGEYCAIFYNKSKLEKVDGGTFWLSETPLKPGKSWNSIYPRICSWVSLKHLGLNTKVHIFNTHYPLNPLVQEQATKLILKRQKQVCSGKNVYLVGDFNCTPGSSARNLLLKSGFKDSVLSLRQKGYKTYHLNGLGLASLDAIFVSKNISVSSCKIVKAKCKKIWASDHHGLVVTTKISGEP